MPSKHTRHPHGCQGASSAALLELIELISSVAQSVGQLSATSLTTDRANHCPDSSLQMLGDLLVYAVIDENCLLSPDIQAHLGFLYETAQRLLQKIDGDSNSRRLRYEKLVKIKARLSPSRLLLDNALPPVGVATTPPKPRKRWWDDSAGGEHQSSQQTNRGKRSRKGNAPAISPVIFAATVVDNKVEATTVIDHPEIRNALQTIFSRSSFDLFILIWTQYHELWIGMPACENLASWPKITVLPKLETVYTCYTRLMSTLSAPAYSQKSLCYPYALCIARLKLAREFYRLYPEQPGLETRLRRALGPASRYQGEHKLLRSYLVGKFNEQKDAVPTAYEQERQENGLRTELAKGMSDSFLAGAFGRGILVLIPKELQTHPLVNPQDDAAKAAVKAFCTRCPDSILLCRRAEQYMSFVESRSQATQEFRDIGKDRRLQGLFASVFRAVSDPISTPVDEGGMHGHRPGRHDDRESGGRYSPILL